MFFFFNQKAAYELRISDGSSDVCSSDLRRGARRDEEEGRQIGAQRVDRDAADREAEGLGIARRIEQPARPDDGKESRPEQDRTAQDHIDHHSSPQFAQQAAASRSEEHTSELQSLMSNSYAVFCLKKTTNAYKNIQHRVANNKVYI